MKLYYHHVGVKGAELDFPKTVINQKTIEEIETFLSDKDEIEYIKKAFPSGKFNCWGVPEGAKSVIKNLTEGDAVLLIKKANLNDGKIPFLGIIKFFIRRELPELSKYLWGNERFPFIFFFNTETIDYSWSELVHTFGYKENFRPAGQFYKANEVKLVGYKKIEDLIYSIIPNSITSKSYSPKEEITINKVEESQCQYDIIRKLDYLDQEPLLYEDNLDKSQKTVTQFDRDENFKKDVRAIYQNRCAISGISLYAPNGEIELQAAHIFPKSQNGRDDVRNGILLTRIFHWALDCGWISISDDYRLLVRQDIPKTDDFKIIWKYEGTAIRLPLDKQYYPHKLYLAEHRKLFKFEDEGDS